MRLKSKLIICLLLSGFLSSQLALPVHARYIPEIILISHCTEDTDETKYYDVPLDNEMQDYIREMLDEFEVDVPNGLEIVLAMAHTESRFKTDVINGDCKGIMQVSEIHKETLEDLGVQDLYDPYDCFKAGVYYLKQGFDNAEELWDELDDCTLSKNNFMLNCALMSYNLGKYGAKNKVLVWDDMDSNTEITLEVKIVENNSKPIKRIIYDD